MRSHTVSRFSFRPVARPFSSGLLAKIAMLAGASASTTLSARAACVTSTDVHGLFCALASIPTRCSHSRWPTSSR